MKTTIELPDALAAEARDFARSAHTSLRDLVVEGLRSEIDRRRAGAAPIDFVFPSVDGNGLRPGVRESDLSELAYEL
jgi:hypothetical protein